MKIENEIFNLILVGKFRTQYVVHQRIFKLWTEPELEPELDPEPELEPGPEPEPEPGPETEPEPEPETEPEPESELEPDPAKSEKDCERICCKYCGLRARRNIFQILAYI